ncbi:MAG: class I SAM-dependent methyltransferase [Rhodocyclaceae bacterium]|nr:MAG: class I SAM-dependent methyltransferase [Rhodocyclaceae bacterium]
MDNSNHEAAAAPPVNSIPDGNALAAPWVRRFSGLISPGGEVLDLACGGGRHARYLASLGHVVEAVDRDATPIEALRDIPGINARCADLEGGPWPYGGRHFAGVIVTNYLWRPLFAQLMATLDKGGILIYETFMIGHEAFGKPSNPAFLLRRDELRHVVRGHLEIVAFEQGEISEPRPAVVQRLCAVRGGPLRLPAFPALLG